MAKISFINAYELSNLGTRILSSYAIAKGHKVHNILLGTPEFVQIESQADIHEGYQVYNRGKVIVNKATCYKISPQDTELMARVLKAEQPDIVGFSARSTNNWLIPVLVPVLQQCLPSALLIAGGFGPTLEPELYLDGGFHCVVRGDGEAALAELMECVDLQKRTGKPQAQGRHILNTVWKIDGVIHTNKLRPQEKNISQFGSPLHGDEYFSFINDGTLRRCYDPTLADPTYYSYLGRGCIGHCTYCSGGQWASLYKNDECKAYKRRNRDLDEVFDELKKIPKNTAEIIFVDEFFGFSSQKTLEFCKLYKKHIDKRFFCHINYDYMLNHRHVFDALIDAGLYATNIGFQSGSEKFAKEHYHRNFRNENLIEFARLCFEANLTAGIHFIGGNCYETEDVFQETLSVIRNLPFSIEEPWRLNLRNIRLRPHPKTPITFLQPKVVSHPMSAKEWFYRAIIQELSRIVSEEEIADLRKNTRWKSEPVEFNQFYQKTLLNKQREHFHKVIQSIHNKRVVFYGAGQLYEMNKPFFGDLKPEALLIDKGYPIRATMDDIPVYTADDFLQQNRGTDIVYVTFIEGSCLPRIKLYHKFGVPNHNMHSCTSLLEPVNTV